MDKSNLIVNYLQTNVTEEDLSALFGSFGSIQSLKIVRDKATGISMGFGFVNFDTNEAATTAAEGLNGLELHGKRIKVSVARPAWKANIHSNLYIANLPTGFTEEDVSNLVGPELSHSIEHIRMLRNSEMSHGTAVGGDFRGVAVARFDTEDSACIALEILCQMTVESPLTGSRVQVLAKPWRPEFRPERASGTVPVVPRPPRRFDNPTATHKLSIESDIMYSDPSWAASTKAPAVPSTRLSHSAKPFVPSPPPVPSNSRYRLPPPTMTRMPMGGMPITENEESILCSSFEQFGALPGVTIYGDRSWGYVRFPTMHAAMAAVNGLTGFNVNGKILEMEAAI
jgi:ELAV like protein 2/3/4